MEEGEKLEEIKQDGQKYYLPSSIYKNLYTHQQVGINWLLGLFNKKEGGLLCDEMGLGKTITVISFLSCLQTTLNTYEDANKEPDGRGLKLFKDTNTSHLLITPVTIMKQWKSELLAWDPASFSHENVWILHESADNQTRERTIRKAIRTRGVLIASYELVRIYSVSFLRHAWNYIILDEGQKIKNPQAQVTQVCQRLKGLNRIVLTGTPIQNSVRELWSLFDFACPGFLGDLQTFEKDFCGQIIRGSMANANGDEKDAAHRCTCVLRNLIVPRILRRTRKEITFTSSSSLTAPIQLPSKKEYVLYCSMGKEQADLYQKYVAYKNLKTMLSNCYTSYNEGLFAGITHLRKLANHPDLLFGTDQKKFLFGKEMYGEVKEYREYNEQVKKELADCTENFVDPAISQDEVVEPESNIKRKAQAKVAAGRWELSFKFVLLKKMLRKWKKEKHKALIFAQTRKLLDIIEEFVKSEENRYTYLRLDGQTPVKQRMVIIDKFNNDPSVDLFLLTTKVGGVGINLVGATRVLIFEPDWNPMADAQAKDRAVRIGQLKDVVIYRLVLANCIEEKIYHRQLFKEFLARKVLKDPFLEKSFSYKDLYDFFDTEGADKRYPPATLIQKRKIDTEKSREDTSEMARMFLKKRYADELEKEVVEAKKFRADQEEDSKEEIRGEPKKGKKPRKKVKGVKQKEQEMLAKVFADEGEIYDPLCVTKPPNKLAEKILGKFEESRIKRATELQQDIEAGFYITPLEETNLQDETAKEREKLREGVIRYLETNKEVKTEELMEFFDKNFKQEQFVEFKALLQNVAKLSPEAHTWALK